MRVTVFDRAKIASTNSNLLSYFEVLKPAILKSVVSAIALPQLQNKHRKKWCQGWISFMEHTWKVNQTDSKLRITCHLRADVIEKN
ncbi:MAG TPA: hypothetical protein DEV81_14260 [Cyanobacteria bacterium UBA11049]|nr:hypothetical protein [Cyanobacteria bacterium UBA11049]